MNTESLVELKTAYPTTQRRPHPKRYRLTIGQYQAISRAGVFREDTHVELLGGILVRQMTKNPPHNFVVNELGKRLYSLLSPDQVVYEEKSIVLAPRWQPEPDIAVLIGPKRRYEAVAPTASDVVLVIEVSDSSYTTDRGIKWRKYAGARISTYWIVNLTKCQVEVYRQPSGNGIDAAYDSIEIFGINAAVPVIIGGQEVARLNVVDLLPSAQVEEA